MEVRGWSCLRPGITGPIEIKGIQRRATERRPGPAQTGESTRWPNGVKVETRVKALDERMSAVPKQARSHVGENVGAHVAATWTAFLPLKADFRGVPRFEQDDGV